MSWSEVVKINNNMKYSINEQIRNNRFLPARVITESTDFTPEKSGYYKVICVGAGGKGASSGNTVVSGGAGGVAIKTYRLNSTQLYNISISYGNVIFNNEVTANGGTDASSSHTSSIGIGGTAIGGDLNYKGENGTKDSTYPSIISGASVGCYIPELSQKYDFMSMACSGYGICGYGYSGAVVFLSSSTERYIQSSGSSACIIIPLEYSE